MRSTRVLALRAALTLGLGAAPQAPPPPAQSSAAIHVGILREDAVLIPFARFDGTAWTTPWPDGLDGKSDPSQLGTTVQIPPEWWGGSGPQREWRLIANGRPKAVNVRGGVLYENHCTGGVGLTTDYTSTVKIESNAFPLPYAGIVVSASGLMTPGVATTAVTTLKRGREFDEVKRQLPALLRRLEPPLWNELDEDWKPDLSGNLPAPSWISVYAANVPDGRRLIYFGASRALPRNVKGGPSELATRLAGWFVRARGAAALTLLDARVSQTDVDGKGGEESFAPMASLTIAGRTFWIGSSGGYEWERYVIVDVTSGPPREVASLDAGGC